MKVHYGDPKPSDHENDDGDDADAAAVVGKFESRGTTTGNQQPLTLTGCGFRTLRLKFMRKLLSEKSVLPARPPVPNQGF